MRIKIAAGNWKMNTTLEEGRRLINAITEGLLNNPSPLSPNELQVVFGVPFITLESAVDMTKEQKQIKIAAQNCCSEEKGAFTGEVSAAMIRSTGAQCVIIGHSERREYFNESHAMLAKKVDVALKNNLIPIFCCGEKLEIRHKNDHFDLVKKQIEESLFHLNPDLFAHVVIAYEPVWAIGTGVTATPQQAQEMHNVIREFINKRYGNSISNSTTILYGGSVNAGNAGELFSQPDVDGGLIGGASLKADEFLKIIHSF
ncbi:MAG: triose-phosphate isomerase [Bacteroidales bacterium]|jgi:triosephosphate isomerase|nr:triose-phosphate isomerase [Bacteroidales bacterium]MDI9593463.1 triose-phosphate isomerase [Bacteroidota bacterium]HOF81814.1 triose-phosphate isomerase [Bacteroidales bacterium]HOR77090.1 triose-phosphate isomerase [Bacteroidales bacterium]